MNTSTEQDEITLENAARSSSPVHTVTSENCAAASAELDCLSLKDSSHKCGSRAKAPEMISNNVIATPTATLEAAETKSVDSNASPDEDSLLTDVKSGDPPTPPAPRTRIGRWVRDESVEGGKFVDEADWEASPSTTDKTFALTLKEEYYSPYQYSPDGLKMHITLSPTLQKLVRSVVKFFPGIGLEGSKISFDEPYAVLYFYYDDLRKATELDFDCGGKEDLDCLVRFYEKWVRPEHDEIREMIQHGSIQYNYLWALFRPGDLVYTVDEFGEPRLYMLSTTKYRNPEASSYDLEEDPFSMRRFHRFALELWSITWVPSTNMFQRLSVVREIRSFDGGCPITTLPLYPVKYYKNRSEPDIEVLLSLLEQRGQRWKSLISKPPSCQFYCGPGSAADIVISDVYSVRPPSSTRITSDIDI
jgi:hypothetical protein